MARTPAQIADHLSRVVLVALEDGLDNPVLAGAKVERHPEYEPNTFTVTVGREVFAVEVHRVR
jgi:hypothetical protein